MVTPMVTLLVEAAAAAAAAAAAVAAAAAAAAVAAAADEQTLHVAVAAEVEANLLDWATPAVATTRFALRERAALAALKATLTV